MYTDISLSSFGLAHKTICFLHCLRKINDVFTWMIFYIDLQIIQQSNQSKTSLIPNNSRLSVGISDS